MRRPLRISTLSLWLVASACGVGTPVCGDGIVSGAETCDDGNLENGDDCTEHCLQPICGDGLLSRGEDCDDGNKNDQDACTSNCLLAYCGDGIQRIDLTRDETGYEACDSPNSATCTDECLRPTLLWNRVMMGGGDSGATTCAYDRSSNLRCWGNNRYGVHGPPIGEDRLAPGPVFEQSPKGIAIGGGHLCEWMTQGTGSCWGLASVGQTGPEESEGCARTTRETCRYDRGDVGLTGIESMAAGLSHNCALHRGDLSCWGSNLHGQLGDPLRRSQRDVPTRVEDLDEIADFALGGFHSCAVMTTGAVQCWGRNAEGQLGNGSDQDAFVPVPVRDLSEVAQLALGDRHSCALNDQGKVSCWGYNGYGQLGQGEIPSPRRCRLGQSSRNHCHRWPVTVAALPTIERIAAGARHTCALGTNGKVWCWGDNRRGQLGDGTTDGDLCIPPDGVTAGCRPGPVQVMDLKNISTIAAGHEATCSVDVTGIIQCWGRNSWGQLGVGDRTDRHHPVILEAY
ncbi:MAG TPA: hypothetical protein DEB46_03745 [Myxococcales bacterium]|nr:hypothetical protein [Myxococcales bacterium]